jgi:hypothetical protein
MTDLHNTYWQSSFSFYKVLGQYNDLKGLLSHKLEQLIDHQILKNNIWIIETIYNEIYWMTVGGIIKDKKITEEIYNYHKIK